MFIEFNETGNIDFYIFKFHNYFDGLLGIDILSKLNAKIDLSTNSLITNNSIIQLFLKPNFTSGRYEVPPASKFIVKIPVDTRNGNFFVKKTYIQPFLYISEGIYNANNWYSVVEMTNESLQSQTFLIEQPTRTQPYDTQENLEVHNFNIETKTTALTEDIVQLLRTDHLNAEERKALCKLCRNYDDIFFREDQKLSFTNKIKHRINTSDDLPVYVKSYRYPHVHKEEVRKQINKMLDQGVIRHSFSPWSAPVWVVAKKRDASNIQKWRMVIDYRKLNEKTICDRYPIPNISEILDKLGKSLYFTTLDLASGFHQIEMHPRDIKKTAFSVEGGHFEFVRMPFGLMNAPSTFQRVMDNVLRDLIGTVCLVFLDDIIVYSTSLQEHMENLKKVFDRLRESNLKIQLDKSEFLHKSCAFLGHVVSTDGIRPNPEKISAVKNFPIPKTPKQIKTFLGLLGYYRKFINDFANLTKPLTSCLKKGSKIVLNERYVQAFETCKNILTNDPLLQYPDFSKPFNLTTDASNFALGAVLSQGPIGSDKPICYASRTLTDSEINYSTIEKELLAIVWATKYFRSYLFGNKFRIITDHRPLTWVMNLKEPNSKLIRWRLKLEEFNYEIIYKKGKANTNADALSRVKVDHIDEEGVNKKEELNMNVNDNLSDHATSGSTIHSAEENVDDGIPISEKPLNDFNIQFVFIKSNSTPMTVETVFKNKQRRTIRRPKFNEEIVREIFQKFFPANKLLAIYSEDEIFHIIQSVYSKYFANNKIIRLVRCTELLNDVKDNDEQDKIIRDYHIANNHRGIQETFLHLKRDFYFPFMKNKIIATINNCDTCQTLKYDRNPHKTKYEIPETPLKPVDIIHIDIYSINKHNILTIIDKFSKFASAYTLPSRHSICILKCMKNYLSIHGIPKQIVCDQGAEFTANIFQDFCKQYNISLHITSFQQSTSNAPVERLHSTITEIYRIVQQKFKKANVEVDHDDILSEILITYNNSIHSATKLTPYELFYGRTHVFNRNIKYTSQHEYLEKLKIFQNELYALIKNKLETETQSRIDKLNLNRENPDTLEKDEEVYRKECRRNKLTPRFSKHRVKSNRKVTIITYTNKKIHKSKIKRRKKN